MRTYNVILKLWYGTRSPSFSYIISYECLLFRGDYKAADNILQRLADQQIRYGSKLANSFILGAAIHGDTDMLNQHIEISECGDNGNIVCSIINQILRL